ncbi:MAG TPA: class I SAM-dependent methyltransferase [Piscinibacter sp.]|jgi:ubiquinone/menaquinone biosynthesis C-methylase UbiE|uniref:class I SAM-dependent methyltransferase n=1 Tax=Piscinibacter sp. TaxID=1903157 RepID=UPI001B71FD44|nr:class I SAM-dependent methyltransferase [Piscinibacter sp.]MBK7533192.1 class I SAM-dependent methyltransferase [Piscinibacter sp.]MBP6544150.1 class I SAM-dependent methyltransferase [Piscinibacter sp.]HOY33553.1 class I SAM-dependent methyltransferase [Piscinibacter sp.]HPG78093.1 class I SAM-dependent methyltransferase [Piscinibacter sp.]HPM67912.1 class I SAM-dependent methyltransferase [Piscinibacter sp.]
MSHTAADAVFAGSVPEIYERYFVPLIFEPYAADLARRAAALRPARVLETAAGTGVVTRALSRALPASAEIVATDLNPPMLAQAAAIGTTRPVQWQQADAMQLPFGDASFDLVVCQFGAMFFPDRVQAFAQARRVLRAGGTLLFNVWDGIEHNELADVVTQTLAEVFPADPPRFMARTPHGHGDLRPLFEELRAAGFAAAPHNETITARSGAASAGDAAFAYCQGTPLRNEIEARQSPDLAAATAACTAAIARRFGDGLVDTKIQAHVVSVAR